MELGCSVCKCNSCGNLHNCEIIMETIIRMDKTNDTKCVPICNCDQYLEDRDMDIFKDWNCLVREVTKKGDELE